MGAAARYEHLVSDSTPLVPAPSRRHRRRKGLGIVYLVAGLVALLFGLLLILGAAAPEEDDESVWAFDFDSVMYWVGGFAAVTGALITAGAIAGLRGYPFSRTLVAVGLASVGLASAQLVIGVVYLLLLPTLIWWRERPPALPERAAQAL